MTEFTNFYNTLKIDWVILGFMMFMSLGAALFHTLIIGSLWNINFKPKQLFFLLNPALIVGFGLIDKRLGALIFIILFVSVFILGIIGMILASIRENYKNLKEDENFRKKNGKKPIIWWKKVLMILGGLTFFILTFTLGAPYIILIFFIILPFLSSIFNKTNKKIFYKLQRDLPTASIRSVAMGLAEISGKTKVIDPIISRIGDKQCIGYLYTKEKIIKKDKGKKSYSLIFSETICNPFFVADKTGEIKISSDEIEFLDFDIDKQYHSSNKRYTQYILKENMDVLLIGKVGVSENNEPIFQKEEIKNVFGIATVTSVKKHNDIQPFLKAAAYFIYFWFILIALILLTPIDLKNNSIEFGEINWEIPFNNSDD